MIAVVVRGLTSRSTVLFSAESVLIAATVGLGLGARAGAPAPPRLILSALVMTAVCQCCLYYRDLYDSRVCADRAVVFGKLLQSFGAAAGVLAVISLAVPHGFIDAPAFIFTSLALTVVMPAWRVVFEWTSRRLWPRQRLLVVGTTGSALAFAREIRHLGDRGVDIIGFVDFDGADQGPPGTNVLGGLEDIPAIVRARSIDQVVVSLIDARGKLPMQKLLEMKLDGVQFEQLPSVYERYTGRIAVEDLRPSWLIFSPGFQKGRLLRAAKRAIDVIGAAVALVVALPLMSIIALAVKLTSKGPVLYRQSRVGVYGRVFTIRKFRSMRVDAEAASGAVWAKANDARVTSIGGTLRRLRLDELPQLWNVLCGEMSLVGPRPERPEFVRSLSKDIPFYGQRHIVRPGLSGWAQVCYTYGATVEDAMHKLQYDLFYVKNMSLSLDLLVLLKTIKVVMMGVGAR